MKEIFEPLNSYQEFPGPILLLAGPGTGKTFQLAKRIKFLIEELNADPDEIAVITFTKEAARNMRERLTHSDINIGPEKTPKTIQTMHSLANAIIGGQLELREYGVLTEKHQRTVLLKDATTLAGYEREKWKLAGECREKGACDKDDDAEKCTICNQYRILLHKCLLLDHDEQIFLACSALRDNPELKAEWQTKTRFLLVDEYQDINQAQYELIEILTKDQEDGFFAVGDDDQSIYYFRGGSPRYIRNYEEHFGKLAKIGRLSKSWRCPEHILKGARSMVTKFYKGSVLKPEPTFSEDTEGGEKIVFYDVPNEQWEAEFISKLTEEKIKNYSVTIIIPNYNYFPPIRNSLRKRKINYNYKTAIDEGGIVRLTILAEWVENQDSNIILRQLLDLIIQNHDELTKTFPIRKANLSEKRDIASEQIARLWNEVNKTDSMRKVLYEKADSEQFLGTLKADCLDQIVNLLDATTSGRRNNLPKFLEKGGLFVAPGRNPKGLISEIREWKTERLTTGINTSYIPVSIYNLPSCKGLEADVIFIVGASEELTPSLNGDIEEESRRFYVAMTRAKKELFIFSARKRPASITYHPASYQLSKSRFIGAIPREHIEIRTIYPKKKA